MRRRLDIETLFSMFSSRQDPRPPQALLLLPILVDLAFRAGGTWTDAFSASAWTGYALLLAATLGALVVGPRKQPTYWTVVLPLLDIAGIGFLRLTNGAPPIAGALVFPAIWLGLQLGTIGVWLASVGTAVAMVVPAIFWTGLDAQTVERAIEVVIIVVITAVLVATTRASWERQRRLQDALVRSVDVGLLLVDADQAYTVLNPRQQEFLRLAFPPEHPGPGEASGYLFARDGHTPVGEQEAPTYRAMQREEFSGQLVWVGPEPDDRRALAVSSRNVYDEHGRFDGAVLAYHDVTDLMAALRAKDDFVAAISHELRTPLTSIVGYLDLVLSDPGGLSPDAQEHLGVASRNAERLIRLVSDLLQSPHHAVNGVERVPVDLHGVVVRAASAARRVGTSSGVTVSWTAADDVRVAGDEARLGQVVDNLFTNAVKYSRPGDTVSASLTVEGDQAVVVVSDTGIGIEPASVDRLFQRFYRSEEARRLGIPGVGLGLSISKDIVEAHGGTISVSSELQRGSRFEVRLPLVREPERLAGRAGGQ